MTYGWAILIIAVVLGVLFQLGAFNPMTFVPKATPGSCQVIKVGNTRTLAGVCTNMIPQYAAMLVDHGTGITIPQTAHILNGSNSVTIIAWVKNMTPITNWKGIVSDGGYGTPNSGFVFVLQPFQFRVNGSYVGTSIITPKDQWMMVAASYNGTSGRTLMYKNSTVVLNTTIATGLNLGQGGTFYIGLDYWSTFDNLGGMMADVQIYNTSLSVEEENALYLEGIGGVPIDTQHIIAWWPLNGDANDYSGNNNNGQIYIAPGYNSNFTFRGDWYLNYVQP